ncbi:DUF3592 domain-containing protein [Streptomyces sp. NPDC091292]|uniref:DUF3592 domain-containing protein n=1 Tax=Streptomyces sp. NPDC091292 TaxID=3365991 RepID=UPI0037FC04C2
MSTVDPVAERRRKQRAARERGPGVGTFIGVVLCAGFWYVCGRGFADAAAYPVGTGYLPSELAPPNATPPLLWMLFVGLFGGLITGLSVRATLAERTGPLTKIALSSAMTHLPLAAGVLIGARSSWIPAPDDRGSWGVGAWLSWTSQYWVPALLVLYVVLRITVSARVRRARTRRESRAREVMATGTRTQGVVTDVTETGAEIRHRPHIRIVVKFTDHEGVTRWVTKSGTVPRPRIPRQGTPATVWFDRSTPSDESAIPIALTPLEDTAPDTPPGTPEDTLTFL